MECSHCGQFDAFRTVLVNGFVCNLCGGFNRVGFFKVHPDLTLENCVDLSSCTPVDLEYVKNLFGMKEVI